MVDLKSLGTILEEKGDSHQTLDMAHTHMLTFSIFHTIHNKLHAGTIRRTDIL